MLVNGGNKVEPNWEKQHTLQARKRILQPKHWQLAVI
jgi:hypothetical protein